MASIVIKVRFGETLRRLNVSINAGKLELDMVLLKEKIRSFFSFGSDVEFTMTYIDEDGDAVTLADDDDLRDVVTQSLNPLRITVNLKGSNFSGPSGNSIALKSPQNEQSNQILNSAVSEVLKSVPEPLLEAVGKLSLDLASKTSSSAPGVADLVQKMKAVYLDPVLSSVASSGGPTTTGGPSNVNSESSTVKKSKVELKSEAEGSKSKNKEKKVQKATGVVKFKDGQSLRRVDFKIPHSGYGFINAPISSNSDKKDDISGGSLAEHSKHDSFVRPLGPDQVTQGQQFLAKQMSQQVPHQTAAPTFFPSQLAAGINKNTNNSSSFLGFTSGLVNAFNQFPFSGVPLTSRSDSQGHSRYSHDPHLKRDVICDNNGVNNVFHRGVICDGCGVHPITGPRFKSKVKNDYDLCHFCFLGMGNATDYIRMDYPTMAFGDHHLPPLCSPQPHIPLHNTMQGFGLNPSQLKKLDSLFILDVSVLDGTIMAPLTAFTKTWRMKNNGSENWPYGSRLQWIEGACLSSSVSVDVQIPVNGLSVGKEVDISVDFTAPELPGRYASYWQMVSPSGCDFGQRIWVIIEVDVSMKNGGETSTNLNLPPVTKPKKVYHELKFPVNDSLIIDNDDDKDSVSSTMATISGPLETVCSSVYNSTAVGTALGALPAGPTVIDPISYPEVGFSVMPSVSGDAASVVVQPASISDDQERDPVKVLEAMGFKQLDLNKEILRMNNNDLDKSIDDLCGVLEWDPMLDELREMTLKRT
ncbi:protein JOKA2-like isoform X2 [Bidens hawaiensis]|uniref:protein JOKA2-like isoform X2 n=1 Tax=Bidens hawaiensis TaxID=980011 RepID=UPI00404B353A